jgi:hypothetical protein
VRQRTARYLHPGISYVRARLRTLPTLSISNRLKSTIIYHIGGLRFESFLLTILAPRCGHGTDARATVNEQSEIIGALAVDEYEVVVGPFGGGG